MDMSTQSSDTSPDGFFPASHELIHYYGRVDFSEPEKARFSFPGVNIMFVAKSSQITVHLKDLTLGGIQADGRPAQNFFNVYIDDYAPFVIALNQKDTVYTIAKGLRDVKHHVRLVKRTEALAGKVEFRGIQLDPGSSIHRSVKHPALKMEFIGNSITCGYGVEAESEMEPFSCSTENVSRSYAVLTAESLNAEYNIIAYSGRGVSQNFDRSRVNTMPVVWKQMFPDENDIAWNHSMYIPDIVVINLGTNDFFSGTVVPSYFRYKYQEFLEELRATYPETKIVCLVGPMLNNTNPENGLNMARIIISSIIRNFHKNGDDKIYYHELSQQTGEYGFGADYHPSAEQQKQSAKELIKFLNQIIE